MGDSITPGAKIKDIAEKAGQVMGGSRACGNEQCRGENCRRMAINTQVQKVCMEEGVGFVDMWLNFVGRDDFFYERWTSSDREGCCSSWV